MANLRSLNRRVWISLSMVLSIALVVGVLLGFLAMANGFRQALEGAGSADVAMVLGAGATTELGSAIESTQIHLMQGAPGIAQTPSGTPLISAELSVPVDAVRRSTGLPATVSLRGIGELGLAVRPSVAITQGRMLQRGSNEIVVGRRIASDYAGFGLGETVSFGTSKWLVVGIFETGGTAFESEILADAPVVQSLFNRPNLSQSLRVRLNDPGALQQFQDYSAGQSQLGLTVTSERRYFADQSVRMSRLILLLGWPLAIIMAIGAAAGALNTIYSSVSDRTVEIATVRALGFSRAAAFLGTWAEALALTLVGAGVGVLASYLILDGWAASTVGADNMQIGFHLDLTPGQIGQAAGLALLIGIIGGGLPALRAARMPLRLAMTR